VWPREEEVIGARGGARRRARRGQRDEREALQPLAGELLCMSTHHARPLVLAVFHHRRLEDLVLRVLPHPAFDHDANHGLQGGKERKHTADFGSSAHASEQYVNY